MFKRDEAAIYRKIEKVGNFVIAKEDVRIHLPDRFRDRGLVTLEDEITILGMFAIIDSDNNYAVSKVPAFFKTEPDKINTVTVNDELYTEFSYNKGSAIITNINVPKVDSLPYRIDDEIISKGHIPWYFNYNDTLTMFDESSYYTGLKVGNSPATYEMIVMPCYRDPEDIKTYYRHAVKSYDDLKTKIPQTIPLRTTFLNATSNMSKIMGAYLSDNITSALIAPGKRTERVEKFIRI